MLARENRVSSKREITILRKKGRLFDGENFSLLILDRNQDTPPRFIAVISTKISKLANVRNKVKRSLYEGVRHILVYIKPGHDVMFLVRPGIERKYTQDLMHEVKNTFEKAGILK